MNWLFPAALVAGAFYFFTRPQQNSGDPKTWDLSTNPTLQSLPVEVQKQISYIIAKGTKAQLLALADKFEASGRPDVAALLRIAAQNKGA